MSRRVLIALAATAALFAAPAPVAQAQTQYAQRCDTNLRITNNSSSSVRAIYFNPSSNRNWGPNRLGNSILQPRQSITFQLPQEDNYDFRISWGGNQAAEMRHTDICRISGVIITDDGLRVR
ncbi:hypothetical protein J5Y09_20915 [Roseomonas sp. PWR1]|uniref:Uncharacterized protein n=1 Tax=Roseomonas nitratireducens TaxID=2820810 RepID=A0ABS4AYF9_9PROT|nr:hypothetical protein [Neoroseomonas nitratireducens]MBP0466403.1 hypothetical protein [Neoroseomonas nitratireducens]